MTSSPLESATDPEAAFWHQIVAQPGESAPRLLYADWCDENGRPGMALVQRWLAATGRVPMPYRTGGVIWIAADARMNVEVESIFCLPPPLLEAIPPEGPGQYGRPLLGGRVFVDQRAAEEAIVPAWAIAAQSARRRKAWEPDWSDQRSTVLVPVPAPPPPAPAVQEKEPEPLRVGTHAYLIYVALLILVQLLRRL